LFHRNLAAVALIAIASFVPTSAGAGGAHGRFSVLCSFSHRASDDPIVHPGHHGMAHSHDFFGNRSTDAASTYASMLQAGTTCELPEDTSAYWVPTLLSPSGSPAPVRHLFAYYRDLPVFAGRPHAYPEDFRMIAGYPDVPTGTDNVLGWSCRDDDPFRATPPDCGSRNLKLHLVFPSCWDGVNTDSRNHRSHVAYSVNGRCPTTHPAKLPRLSLHVTYGVSDGRGFQLSSDIESGTSDGRSAHGDFWNTWDQSALERLVDVCLRDGASCLGLRRMPMGGGGHHAGTCLRRDLTFRGTEGPDRFTGTAAADAVATFGGRDSLRSRAGNDRLCAGSDRDTIRAGAGLDRLAGTGGDDVLVGGPGRDVLVGGPGDDLLVGGQGRDRCIGGIGNDTARSCETVKRV
jgi:hypothetical protein